MKFSKRDFFASVDGRTITQIVPLSAVMRLQEQTVNNVKSVIGTDAPSKQRLTKVIAKWNQRHATATKQYRNEKEARLDFLPLEDTADNL